MVISENKKAILATGITLLKCTVTKKGQFIIKQIDKSLIWSNRVVCETPDIAHGIIDKLTENHPDKFQKYENI